MNEENPETTEEEVDGEAEERKDACPNDCLELDGPTMRRAVRSIAQLITELERRDPVRDPARSFE